MHVEINHINMNLFVPNTRFWLYKMFYMNRSCGKIVVCICTNTLFCYFVSKVVQSCMLRFSRLNKSKQWWLCNSYPLDSKKKMEITIRRM